MTLIGRKNMSWIEDVNYELNKIDSSKRSLRKFGITVGIVFLLISIWIYLQYTQNFIVLALGVFASFLIISGIIKPQILKNLNKYWMGLAFILGWFVSRFLLTLLFLFVLTPIALVAKLFGKDFLNISVKEQKDTYWIKKSLKNENYEKMY
jgi:multisubunit Na+/H+ antiporter MnhG subunit